jgi:hypothetical protein
MIGRVKEHPDCNDKQADKIALDYTWEQVFNRIFSVYQAVIQKKHANPDK